MVLHVWIFFAAEVHVKRLDRVCGKQPGLQAFGNFVHRLVLVGVDQMHVPMHVRWSFALVLHCTSEGVCSSSKAANWRHVTMLFYQLALLIMACTTNNIRA